jgi:uncharacterized damage-inducible protein DinB
MKRLHVTIGSAITMLFVGALSAAAQTAAPAQAAPVVETREFAPQAKSQYAWLKDLLTRSADKMPADAFDAPAAPGMRTFAGTLGHAISFNYTHCSLLLGKKDEHAAHDFSTTLKTKAETVKALADVFAYCDPYFAELKPDTRLDQRYSVVNTQRNGRPVDLKISHIGTLAQYLLHNAEQYGYLSVQLRLKGIVPPSSEK